MDHAQKSEISVHFKTGVAVKRRHGGHANVVDQNRVAVRRGTRHLLRGNRATRTQNVFHHHRVHTQRFAQSLGHVARQPVGRPAGGERHDDGDGLVLDRKTLRKGVAPIEKRQRTQQCCLRIFGDGLLQQPMLRQELCRLVIYNCAHLQSLFHRWASCQALRQQSRRATW